MLYDAKRNNSIIRPDLDLRLWVRLIGLFVLGAHPSGLFRSSHAVHLIVAAAISRHQQSCCLLHPEL